jgi:predicted ribosome quality control (RQC) complex YloA/Tae2 family protein
MQPVDLTTLTAVCSELQRYWLPAKITQIYQSDRHTLTLGLRTLTEKAWLTLSWHPQAARICLTDPPPRKPDTFTLSDQLRHQIIGFALIDLSLINTWERVLALKFAHRPGEEAIWHLYLEIMGQYSNIILTDAQNQIITVGYQVNHTQSSIRTVQTGQIYQKPPELIGNFPHLKESQTQWQEKISLIPGKLKQQILASYRGLSQNLAISLIETANLNPEQLTSSLTQSEWDYLFKKWQEWLNYLATKDFTPGFTKQGYTVIGWNIQQSTNTVQELLNNYYTAEINQQKFQQIKHQLQQKITNNLKKLRQKALTFQQRLTQSDQADQYRQKADLLMAYLHQWQPGMKMIILEDFETDQAIQITLDPEKNAVQNAQYLYKQHQKLKRARTAIEPLLQEVQTEINYLEQVEASLEQLETYTSLEDLQTLTEIKEELKQQKYLETIKDKTTSDTENSQPRRYPTPSGLEVWVGRNNRQNDELTFRKAGDYDLWFHSQEIAGSHVLLRLKPGTIPDESDLQYAANLAAYYSKARHSEQVPVVYTEPKNVYKPKGAKPGMAIYKHERIIWGCPQKALINET